MPRTARLAAVYLFLLGTFALLCCSSVRAAEVAFSGFAYSGDFQSIGARFPYARRFEAALPEGGVNALLRKSLAKVQPAGYSLVPRLEELRGRDQAVAVAFVLTNETVSTEQIGPIHKLFIQLRGQALFFDFKSKTVLRAYPFSFAYLDALRDEPDDGQKDAAMSYVFLGKNGKAGVIERFGQALAAATIPTNVPRFVQVANVKIADEVRAEFPAGYGPGVAETWVADSFGEAIAAKMGMPILPYAKGYAIGSVMSMSVADGTVFNLKLPKPDYEFTVSIDKLKKVVYEEKEAGKSLIYGVYATFKLEEPLSAQAYLDGQFKNGEVKVVPAMQVNTEDFPAYQDAIRGLFTKLSGAIAGESTPWLKSGALGKDVDKQILATRELLKSCK